MSAQKHAGVWVPPPVIFALPFVAAAAMQALRRWPITGGDAAGLAIAGFTLIVIAVAIGLSSVARFWRADTTILPAGVPTSAIVDSGPYRFTRNPMYLAMALGYAGLGLLSNNAWALLHLPLAVLAIDRFVIRREERYLAAQFGAPYAAYCARVRRWL